MSKTWFTSDNHFFHKNIKKFCPETRFGDTVEDMNRLMIEIWNNTVSNGDTVYCLGDFSFGSSDDTEAVLKQLKGNIHLIRGNHEKWLDKRPLERYFASVQSYKKITVEGQRVILFHYPIYEWENMHHGSYHLYGHVHGSVQMEGRAMDVGIDARPQKDMGLWSWEEIKARLESQPIRTHHGKHAL